MVFTKSREDVESMKQIIKSLYYPQSHEEIVDKIFITKIGLHDTVKTVLFLVSEYDWWASIQFSRLMVTNTALYYNLQSSLVLYWGYRVVEAEEYDFSLLNYIYVKWRQKGRPNMEYLVTLGCQYRK